MNNIATLVSTICPGWFEDTELDLFSRKAERLGLSKDQWEPCIDEWRLTPTRGVDRLSDLYSRLKLCARLVGQSASNEKPKEHPDLRRMRDGCVEAGAATNDTPAIDICRMFHKYQAEKSMRLYGYVDYPTVTCAQDSIRILVQDGHLESCQAWDFLGEIMGHEEMEKYRAWRVDQREKAKVSISNARERVMALAARADADEKNRKAVRA